MNEQTLEALKESIEKWEKIVYHGCADRGTLDCALCCLCRNCLNCIVSIHSNQVGCANTPYVEWDYYMDNYNKSNENKKVFDNKSKELAINELNFLKSLLLKGHASQIQ